MIIVWIYYEHSVNFKTNQIKIKNK